MYLITGAAGFIGFHVCEKLLKKNKKVYGIDNIDNYSKIQELVREIVKNGFDCREIMKTFADYACKQEVYKLVTEHDHKLAMGYRELIHMEALFYDIHLLLK